MRLLMESLVPTPPPEPPAQQQRIGVVDRDDAQESAVEAIRGAARTGDVPLRLAQSLRANLESARAALAALPPRLMICDAEAMPRHERIFRVLPAQATNDGGARPTITWGKNDDGRAQMSWKTCSSRPPKRRIVARVSAEDYPPFALGFEIETDQGPVKVNAPNSDAKARWLDGFASLDEAVRLCGLPDGELQRLASGPHHCRSASDVKAALSLERAAAAEAERAEASAAFVERAKAVTEAESQQ
jgi:hypothetical protein